MIRHFIKKYIFTVIFCAGLLAFSVINAVSEAPRMEQAVNAVSLNSVAAVSVLTESISDTADTELLGRHAMLEIYGFTQNALNTCVENGFAFVRDENGALEYTDTDDVSTGVTEKRTIKLMKLAKEHGAEFMMVLVPDKVLEEGVSFREGLPYRDVNQFNDIMAELAQKNDIFSVNANDYVDDIKKTTGESVFYNTDHHFRTKAGFYIFCKLSEAMDKEYGLNLDPEGIYTDAGSYNSYHYDRYFLGSMGRVTGVNYAGLDDFDLMYPKFRTDFTRKYKCRSLSPENEVSGPFLNSIIVSGAMKNGNIYQSDRYSSYIDGVDNMDMITNNLNAEAPRVLIIRDSYMACIASFMSNEFSETDLLWSVEYNGDFGKLLDEGNYDYVIYQFGAINMNNPDMLKFVDSVN